MKQLVLAIIAVCFLSASRTVHAGGAAMQKRKAQQQAVMQRAIIQRQIQMQQMQQAKQEARQMATQAIVEQQKKEIQEVLIQKQMIARQVAVAQQQAAQQAIMAQQYSVQQAAAVQRQAMQQAAIQQKAVQEIATQKAIQARMYQMLEEDAQNVQDVVTLDELVQSLDQSSDAWDLIMDAQAKQIVVDRYIQRFRERGVNINNGALYYAYMIDDMSKNAPQMLQQPFENILEVIAIIEYDFDNGQDKDALAHQFLGPEEFERNKARLLNR